MMKDQLLSLLTTVSVSVYIHNAQTKVISSIIILNQFTADVRILPNFTVECSIM